MSSFPRYPALAILGLTSLAACTQGPSAEGPHVNPADVFVPRTDTILTQEYSTDGVIVTKLGTPKQSNPFVTNSNQAPRIVGHYKEGEVISGKDAFIQAEADVIAKGQGAQSFANMMLATGSNNQSAMFRNGYNNLGEGSEQVAGQNKTVVRTLETQNRVAGGQWKRTLSWEIAGQGKVFWAPVSITVDPGTFGGTNSFQNMSTTGMESLLSKPAPVGRPAGPRS